MIGAYGAGKTFFLFLIRQIALQSKLAVCQADLAPERRIHATNGQARSLYAELARSLSTRTAPEGGALRNILESYIQKATERAGATGVPIETAVKDGLGDIREMVAGYDFATVVAAYARGYEDGNSVLQDAALRWLRGEYTTKTEARQDLGVRTILDDASFYDGLRLLAKFVRVAGFGGMIVCLDELVNLYKLQSAQARKQNYEQILRILNDVLQGTTEGIGFILGGTPEFLLDTRRGLYSYEALQSRLAENSFAVNGLADYSGPVINLPSLTPRNSSISRSRKTPRPRRSARRFHATLLEHHWRCLLPDPAKYREGVCRFAGRARAEPRCHMERFVDPHAGKRGSPGRGRGGVPCGRRRRGRQTCNPPPLSAWAIRSGAGSGSRSGNACGTSRKRRSRLSLPAAMS